MSFQLYIRLFLPGIEKAFGENALLFLDNTPSLDNNL
jgi:hypothetical protein